jgi:hypothetical protein
MTNAKRATPVERDPLHLNHNQRPSNSSPAIGNRSGATPRRKGYRIECQFLRGGAWRPAATTTTIPLTFRPAPSTSPLPNLRTSNKTLGVTDGATTAGYLVEHDAEFFSCDAEFVLLGTFASPSGARSS